MQKIWTDRSRIETFQRCNRLRWLEYHERGIGITSKRKPLPLAVGGSVHVGLAGLLRYGVAGPDPHHGDHVEEKAVAAALTDFATYQAALDIGEEQQEMTQGLNSAMQGQDAELATRAAELAAKGRNEFDQWLYDEQKALVEALVRAYSR